MLGAIILASRLLTGRSSK